MWGIKLGLSETESLLGTDSPWTRWHNKLYSTVLECSARCVLQLQIPQQLDRDNPETNPITINQRLAEQLSWVPLLSCSPSQDPFPIVFCFVSTCASSDNSFQSVRQEFPFGPWKGFFQEQNGKSGTVILSPKLKLNFNVCMCTGF